MVISFALGLLFANTATVKTVIVSQLKRKRTSQRDSKTMKDERIHHAYSAVDKSYLFSREKLGFFSHC